ncbi:hypothetical protein H9M94_01295 [Mycoplasma sp. Pen4]|uniref:hypothetical protein n=1 Tax=Mycoplasma sp. Pen4 TaxID=640330 RepID=UPI0016544AFF|nr:hypothetical protein [Mycoplasma sp. Pen4]QNM93893.1 hypothetical protein H9M94_01295 [Mycoplasma sp. Pen4]
MNKKTKKKIWLSPLILTSSLTFLAMSCSEPNVKNMDKDDPKEKEALITQINNYKNKINNYKTLNDAKYKDIKKLAINKVIEYSIFDKKQKLTQVLEELKSFLAHLSQMKQNIDKEPSITTPIIVLNEKEFDEVNNKMQSFKRYIATLDKIEYKNIIDNAQIFVSNLNFNNTMSKNDLNVFLNLIETKYNSTKEEVDKIDKEILKKETLFRQVDENFKEVQKNANQLSSKYDDIKKYINTELSKYSYLKKLSIDELSAIQKQLNILQQSITEGIRIVDETNDLAEAQRLLKLQIVKIKKDKIKDFADKTEKKYSNLKRKAQETLNMNFFETKTPLSTLKVIEVNFDSKLDELEKDKKVIDIEIKEKENILNEINSKKTLIQFYKETLTNSVFDEVKRNIDTYLSLINPVLSNTKERLEIMKNELDKKLTDFKTEVERIRTTDELSRKNQIINTINKKKSEIITFISNLNSNPDYESIRQRKTQIEITFANLNLTTSINELNSKLNQIEAESTNINREISSITTSIIATISSIKDKIAEFNQYIATLIKPEYQTIVEDSKIFINGISYDDTKPLTELKIVLTSIDNKKTNILLAISNIDHLETQKNQIINEIQTKESIITNIIQTYDSKYESVKEFLRNEKEKHTYLNTDTVEKLNDTKAAFDEIIEIANLMIQNIKLQLNEMESARQLKLAEVKRNKEKISYYTRLTELYYRSLISRAESVLAANIFKNTDEFDVLDAINKTFVSELSILKNQKIDIDFEVKEKNQLINEIAKNKNAINVYKNNLTDFDFDQLKEKIEQYLKSITEPSLDLTKQELEAINNALIMALPNYMQEEKEIKDHAKKQQILNAIVSIVDELDNLKSSLDKDNAYSNVKDEIENALAKINISDTDTIATLENNLEFIRMRENELRQKVNQINERLRVEKQKVFEEVNELITQLQTYINLETSKYQEVIEKATEIKSINTINGNSTINELRSAKIGITNGLQECEELKKQIDNKYIKTPIIDEEVVVSESASLEEKHNAIVINKTILEKTIDKEMELHPEYLRDYQTAKMIISHNINNEMNIYNNATTEEAKRESLTYLRNYYKKAKIIVQQLQKIITNDTLPYKLEDKEYVASNEEDVRELVKFFDYIVSNRIIGPITFGNAKVRADALGKAYGIWFRTHWVKYPYLSMTNGLFIFSIKGNEQIIFPNTAEYLLNGKPLYVDKLENGRYANSWLKDTIFRENFKDLTEKVTSLIKEGMTDYEKAAALFMFTLQHYSYTFKANMSSDLAYFNYGGVCADYGSFFALICNIAGLEALPMSVGFESKRTIKTNITDSDNKEEGNQDDIKSEANAELHEIAWVKIKATSGKYYWMKFDPTWADDLATQWKKYPYSHYIGRWDMKNNFFEVLGKNKFEPRDNSYSERTQYNWNNFWGLPYTEPILDDSEIRGLYDENKTELGFDNNDNLFLYLQNYINKEKKSVSTPIFFDGYWLYVENERETKSSGLLGPIEFKFKYRKFIDSNEPKSLKFNPPLNQKSKLYKLYQVLTKYEWLISAQNNSAYSNPNIFERNNKLFIPTYNFSEWDSTNKPTPSIFVFDLDNLDKDPLEIKLPLPQNSTKRKLISNFYLDHNNELWVFYDETDRHEKISLTSEQQEFINSRLYNQQDVENVINKYSAIIGVLLEDNSRDNLPSPTHEKPSYKESYYKVLDDIRARISLSKTSDDNKELINEVINKYNSMIMNNIIRDDNKFFISKDLDDRYGITLDNFKKYGLTSLTSFNVLENADNLLTKNETFKYDIYYSETKENPNYKLIKRNVFFDSLKISRDELGKDDPEGYYYIEVYKQGKEDQKVKSNIAYVYSTNGLYANESHLNSLKVALNGEREGVFVTNIQRDSIKVRQEVPNEFINSVETRSVAFKPTVVLDEEGVSSFNYKILFRSFANPMEVKEIASINNISSTITKLGTIDINANEPGIYYAVGEYVKNDQQYKIYSETSFIFNDYDTINETLVDFFNKEIDIHK